MKTIRCVLLTFFIVSKLHAQTNVGTDTFALAMSIAYEKDFETADYLLTKHNAKHPDIRALSFHGQVLYWNKEFDRSIAVYEKAIRIYPQPSSLHLEYARVLYNLKRLTKARRLLDIYRHYDSSNAEADIMTAYLDLWNGKLTLAEKEANILLAKYPENAEAKNIISQISNYTIPYFKTGTEFFSDDQPLTGQIFYAEAGVYKSRIFAPTAQFATYQYTAEHSPFHSLWMQGSNTFNLATTNKIKLRVGLYQQNGQATDLTGGAEVTQQVGRNFSLYAAVERRPYQNTVSSVKSPVMEGMSAVTLSYNRRDKWLSKAGYEFFQYNDANKIHTAYFWILAPVISRSRFSVSGGYAFRYADAISNHFVSKLPVSQIIVTPSYDGIAGVYNPYFTPENQKIHSALASVKIIPSKKLAFTSRISIGLIAKADNPYLWLDPRGSRFVVKRSYTSIDFMPATWVNELRLAASDKFSVAANYSYDQLLYYKSHRGSLELKYLLSK